MSDDDFKLLQDSYFKVWTIYYTWYVWFFGANVGAIGLLATAEHVRSLYIRPIASFMEIFVVLGFFASWAMYRFQAMAKRRAERIRAASLRDVGIVSDVFASPLAKLASICSIIAHGAAVILWMYVFCCLAHSELDPGFVAAGVG